MDQNAMEQAWTFLKEFTSVFAKSVQSTKVTEAFAKDLYEVFSGFARDLQKLIDRNSDGFFESEQNRLLGGSLSKLSASYKSLSVQLKNEVLEPFIMFMENFKATIEAVAKKASESLIELEKQKTLQVKSQQQFYQGVQKLARSKQDIEKAKEKLEKGGKNNDLVKANEACLKIRVALYDQEKYYRDSIDKTNAYWKRALRYLSTLQGMVDYNEYSRISFTKNTTNSILRLLVQYWPIPDKPVIYEVLSRRYSTRQKKYSIASKIDRFVANDKKYQFVSYEESLRKQSRRKESIGDISYLDADLIQNLVDLWIPEENGANTVATGINEYLDKVKLLVMSSGPHSKYFIDSLHRKMQSRTTFYCRMEDEHFSELLNIMNLISRCLGSEDPEVIWKLIKISMRLTKKKKEKANSTTLCSLLGRYKTLQDYAIWQGVWQHLRNRSQRKYEMYKIYKNYKIGIGSFLLQGLKGLNNLVRAKYYKYEDQVKIIQEVATLMSSLCLPSEFCLPVVKKMLDTVGEGSSLDLLKGHLFSKQDMQLRLKLTGYRERAKAKQQKHIDLVGSRRVAPYALLQVAKRGFLNVKDINLRLVCKKLKNVHKVIIYPLDNIPHKYMRLADGKPLDYIRMKTEVAYQSTPSSIEYIITLDVNRSLHIHLEYLPPTLLHTLLRVFAYYNKEIGYCQGMNYLAGYLFIKTRNEEYAYIVFEKLMKERFWEVFVNEFYALKLKMYQFDRLLGIFIPDLADHFKGQMVTPECYIVSWIVALYSSAYQYTKESYLIDELWLRFMVWGWRYFFKFTLWLLQQKKDYLIELSFDKILNTLGEVLRGAFLGASREKMEETLSRRELAEKLDKFRVTSSLLKKLEKYYQMSIQS